MEEILGFIFGEYWIWVKLAEQILSVRITFGGGAQYLVVASPDHGGSFDLGILLASTRAPVSSCWTLLAV